MNHHGAAPSGPRTLTPLGLPDQLCDPGPVVLQRGLYVDCQTTGPEPEYDDVLELAMVPFTYTPEGRIVHVLHQHARVWHNDPGRALPREIAALTGLTDIMVRGQRIDVDAANALIGASNVVVAHNAAAHRPFFEKVAPAARTAAWACSFAEVPWTEAGFVSRALHCLACRYGVVARDRHRTHANCEVGLWLLASVLPGGQGVFAAALRAGVGEHRRAVGGRCAGRGAGGCSRRAGTGGCPRVATASRGRGGRSSRPSAWRPRCSGCASTSISRSQAWRRCARRSRGAPSRHASAGAATRRSGPLARASRIDRGAHGTRAPRPVRRWSSGPRPARPGSTCTASIRMLWFADRAHRSASALTATSTDNPAAGRLPRSLRTSPTRAHMSNSRPPARPAVTSSSTELTSPAPRTTRTVP